MRGTDGSVKTRDTRMYCFSLKLSLSSCISSLSVVIVIVKACQVHLLHYVVVSCRIAPVVTRTYHCNHVHAKVDCRYSSKVCIGLMQWQHAVDLLELAHLLEPILPHQTKLDSKEAQAVEGS